MKLGHTIPVLRIFDEEKAREFYVDFLGFTIDWEHRFGDNFPLYCQVSKDDCSFHLTGHHGDACPGSAVVVSTEDVTGFPQQLLAKDYKHAKPGVDTAAVDSRGNSALWYIERNKSLRAGEKDRLKRALAPDRTP